MEALISMTLITALLIMIYKKLNEITGFKIDKLRFEIELDNFMLKKIVNLCEGDTQMAPHLRNSE